ncbi:saccharopine dehydrogenase family protein [Occallatibacter riparius]|uniref:Saccharopine dehydrogenase NADP-binding domain-containing protein n=1 Tax=Occallatibacter riparius TaxID=1002689 RepID=A0A9J7BLN3_9BACT|nr:saccharopine dehydrogenase C-terminal domain-containing protein [Occallatibacter riparius]UWZ83563.1 saccharopine dehydrogenase NADP-binding domain-containing protein [Occallatibacter riparius]
MSQKIVVLGAGRVGKVIAADLSTEYDVTSADISEQALSALAARFPVKTRVTDLADPKAVGQAIKDADLVVCAVPGFMGFSTLRTILENDKNVVDISFFAEDAFELDDLAKSRNLIAAVDCGVAPGIPDYLAGQLVNQMQIDDFTFYIGGLHFHGTGPNGYLPTFSPIDVWEEYTRPARYVRNGELITMPPLSEPELLDFHMAGHDLRLEAFNTDGLRSLITTMKGRIPDMKEKTLRFPGHIGYIQELQQTRQPWTPNKWTPKDDEDEFTIMQINFRGAQDGQPKKISYDMFVTWDPETRMSSMSRSTGYSCTGVVRCVLEGLYKQKGISPPSCIGSAPGCADRIFQHLKDRNILLARTEEALA